MYFSLFSLSLKDSLNLNAEAGNPKSFWYTSNIKFKTFPTSSFIWSGLTNKCASFWHISLTLSNPHTLPLASYLKSCASSPILIGKSLYECNLFLYINI